MLRVLFFLVIGGAAVWFAWACYHAWQAAVRNSASPGAIVLLGAAGFAALFAFTAFIRAGAHAAVVLRGDDQR